MSASQLMTRTERITHAVFEAMDDINRMRAKNQRLEPSLDAALMGPSSPLDSLALVNLIVAIEERVEEAFGVSISIADERARSQPDSPFASVRTLVGYIDSLLEGRVDG